MNRTRASSVDAFGTRNQRNRIYPALEASDGSTLSLDFTAMSSLDSRFTFSRSGGGSYTASDGLLYGFDQSTTSNTIGTGSKTFTLSATAGVNQRYAVGDLIIASSGANSMSGSVTSYDPSTQSLVCSMASSSGSGTFTTWIIGNRQPRFDYNPTTLAPRGLLIESSAINLCLNGSMAFTSGQPTSFGRVFSQCTVASVDSTTFSGQKAWSISATAAGQRDFLTQSITLVANTTYTVSIYVEAVTGSTDVFSYVEGMPSGSSTTVTNPSSVGRVSYTITVGATGGNGSLRIGIGCSGTNASSNASVRFSHVQVEAGSSASSYILTGASTVQRAADSCQMTGTNFSSWYGSPTASSVLFEGIVVQASTQYRRIFVLTSSASPNTGVPAYSVGIAGAESNRPFLNAHVNAANNVDIYVPVGAAVTNGTKFRIAARAQSGSYRLSRAGQSATSTYSTAPGYPAGLITFGFVADGAFMTSQWISRLIYYPFGISNSQMDAWSA